MVRHRLERLARLTRGAALIGLGTFAACKNADPKEPIKTDPATTASEPKHINVPPDPTLTPSATATQPVPVDTLPHINATATPPSSSTKPPHINAPPIHINAPPTKPSP